MSLGAVRFRESLAAACALYALSAPAWWFWNRALGRTPAHQPVAPAATAAAQSGPAPSLPAPSETD